MSTTQNEWRSHPHFKGRSHPDYPDDVQVVVHDGGPRIAKSQPELVWVRVTRCTGDLFTGIVLNAPTQLATVRQNQEIRFWLPGGSKFLVIVTDKYLAERSHWTITPCIKCGFAELFDAPSDLMKAVFSHFPQDYEMEMFTALCPMCGGMQAVRKR